MATSARRRVLLAAGFVTFKEDDEPPPPETVGSIAVLVVAALVACMPAALFGIWLGGVLTDTPWSSNVGFALFFGGLEAVVMLISALRERHRARMRLLEAGSVAGSPL